MCMKAGTADNDELIAGTLPAAALSVSRPVFLGTRLSVSGTYLDRLYAALAVNDSHLDDRPFPFGSNLALEIDACIYFHAGGTVDAFNRNPGTGQVLSDELLGFVAVDHLACTARK